MVLVNLLSPQKVGESPLFDKIVEIYIVVWQLPRADRWLMPRSHQTHILELPKYAFRS